MLRPDDVARHLRDRPFQPFRIHLSDGTAYDIRHPEMLMVGERVLYVGLAMDQGARDFPVVDRLITVALMHVTRIEPLPAPAATNSPPGNGR